MSRSALALVALCASLSVACGGTKAQPKAPVLPPAVPEAVNKMAQGVGAAKDPGGRSRALELLRAAVKIDPNLWEAHYDLGVLLGEGGELEEAEAALEKAYALAPNAEDVVVALAEVRRRKRDASGAVDVLTPFVKKYPKAVVARISLVGALREAGKVESAIEHAREVLVRRSSDPNALAELALSHLQRGEIDTAELLVTEALKSDPNNAVAERTAGLISLKRGDDAIAFQHFAKASALDPKDTTARINTGTVLLQAGVYDKAAEEFRAVVAIKADDTAAQLGLAASLRGLGSRDKQGPYLEAEKILKSVLEREPKNENALFNLAVLYADFLQRPKDAKPYLEQFLAAASKSHPARAEAERMAAGQK